MSKSPPALHRFARSESGTSATEFALVLPLLMILLVGIFEMGRAFYTYTVIASSVRDSARVAGRMSMSCAGMTNSADVTRLQKLTRTGTTTGTTPVVDGWNTDTSVAVTVTCVPNTGGTVFSGRYDTMANIPTVTVTATVPFTTMLTDLIGLNLPSMVVSHSQVWTE